MKWHKSDFINDELEIDSIALTTFVIYILESILDNGNLIKINLKLKKFHLSLDIPVSLYVAELDADIYKEMFDSIQDINDLDKPINISLPIHIDYNKKDFLRILELKGNEYLHTVKLIENRIKDHLHDKEILRSVHIDHNEDKLYINLSL